MKPHILWGFIWIQIVCKCHQGSSKFTASGLRANNELWCVCRTDIDESNQSHEQYALQLLNNLLGLIEGRADEDGTEFLAKLNLRNTAKNFRVNYRFITSATHLITLLDKLLVYTCATLNNTTG